MVCGRGPGSHSSRPNIYLKLKFAALHMPILAAVSFGQLPWASATTYVLEFREHGKWEGDAGAKVHAPIFT